MTTLSSHPGASPGFGSPRRQNYVPQFTLHDLPHELSSTQLQAKQILAQLLSRLKDSDSIYHDRYGQWVESNPKLEDFCFQCVRPQVWNFLQGRWSLEALKLIGGDLKFEGHGVYLNGVFGLDKRVRIYVGQATSIRQRISQHLNFRYRRDNPSLHYHAMQRSIYNQLGLLALLPSPSHSSIGLPGMDRPDLLLNILEMWMCLVFRALPPQTLETWLGGTEDTATVKKENQGGNFGGLNIASPLDQGAKIKEWIDLSGSDDPLVLDYIGIGSKSKEVEEIEKEYVEVVKEPPKLVEETMHVPQWAVWGGLAAALAFVFLNSRSAPQLRFRGRIR